MPSRIACRRMVSNMKESAPGEQYLLGGVESRRPIGGPVLPEGKEALQGLATLPRAKPGNRSGTGCRG